MSEYIALALNLLARVLEIVPRSGVIGNDTLMHVSELLSEVDEQLMLDTASDVGLIQKANESLQEWVESCTHDRMGVDGAYIHGFVKCMRIQLNYAE